VYTTRDKKTGRISIWGLNFQNGKSDSVKLSFKGLSGKYHLRQLTLKNITGPTTLSSGNQRGVQRMDVDWMESPVALLKPSKLEVNLEPATITLIVMEEITNK
jgi:hypothetical protein